MKTPRFFTLVGVLLCFLFFKPTNAARSEQIRIDDINNYVVIGAFAKQANAVRFTTHAQNDLKLDAKFEMNLRRNLYYVYVLSTEDLTRAVDEARRLRAESEFRDTWVYRGSFTEAESVGVDIVPVAESTTPASTTDPGASQDGPQTTQEAAESSSDDDSTAVAAAGQEGESSASDSDALTGGFAIPAAALGEEDDAGEGTKFLFKISRQSDLKRIRGDVEVVDVDRQRRVGTYQGNLAVRVPSPASQSGKISVICEVFGYRKVQRDLNYNDPENGPDIIRDATGSVVIPFELARLRKGDIAVMYNVYFFKDAAIMRPESNYEVNSLLEMLNENANYKIKIHGHTNGKAAGKIISMEKDSQNFFSLKDTKEGFGSAKQLSDDRAAVLKRFLESNGIDPARREIKAWGGKRPIHDKMSNRAQENVRVEIEILQD
jgi:outer membrane protein OmpA-like peptidoglycan-associated protein